MKKKFIKTIILILSIIGLYDVATCSVMLYPEHKIKQGFNGGAISEKELDEFLPVWSKFIKKYADNAGVSEVSLTQKLPSEALPLKIKIWLKANGWDVNRFFYVEQRLRDDVNYIYIKRHSADVIEVMSKAMENEKNPNSRENIKNVISMQKEIIDSPKLNTPEMLLIERRLDDITSAMEN